MKRLLISIFSLLSVSTAFAIGGTLWNMTVDAYQVQIPCVPESCENNAGWWYPYTGDTEGGQVMSFEPISENEDGSLSLIMTDTSDGSILPNGNLIEDTGLRVAISAANGSASTPAIAGIAFDWLKDGTIDITDMGGIIVDYAWTGALALQIELGWDEDKYGFDTWYTTLPPSASPTNIYLPWSKFKQDGWDKNKHPLKTALENSKSIKIRVKNAAHDEAKGTMTLYNFEYIGVTADISTRGNNQSLVQASVSGKTLTFSGITSETSFEMMNLQGQVVKNGHANASVGLTGVNPGVYLLHVLGKNLNMTQKILVK